MVTLIKTTIAICLMIFFVVHVLEDMRIWLPFYSYCTIHFLIFYTTSCFLSVMFGDISFIALSTFKNIRATTKYQISLFPIILVL